MPLGRKILLGFIACAMILFSVVIYSFKNTEKFIASNALVYHTNKVLKELKLLLITSIDAQTAVRGFVLTGQERFLEPFLEASIRYTKELHVIKELTTDNSIQQKNIEQLEKEFLLHFNYLNRLIELRRKDFELAKELVASSEGKTIQDKIRKIIAEAEGVESTLLAERKKIRDDEASKFNAVFIILLCLIALILFVVYNIVIANLKALKRAEAEAEGRNWLLTGSTKLNEKVSGDQNITVLANNTISFLCTYLNANIGAVYLFNEKENALILTGQYAFSASNETKKKFELNEGLIGQAAQEQQQISLTDIADGQINITSSILNTKPKHLLVTPFLFEGKTIGVIELGKLTDFNETEKEFINVSMDSIAIAINIAVNQQLLKALFGEIKVQKGEMESHAEKLIVANKELAFQNEEKEKRAAELVVANEELAFQNEEKEKRAAELIIANKELALQTEELQVQQEELKQMNEELEEQTQNLRQQQEQLQITNEELENKTLSLEIKNAEIETAKKDIEQKTKQLEISSKYKSEFLANMSHELRTPLNSLLILSKDLSENRKKNLDDIQVESAEIIYKSGHDLLVLINEVLDLSKIEAGMMSIYIESISLKSFAADLVRNFKHQAEKKGLKLSCELDTNLPEFVRTDSQRLNQILKNLLSNAIKFTEKGTVRIHLEMQSKNSLSISVTDTGIGILEEKQGAVFEAFQQAEGGTSRKYGGTGLGLSISNELAKLLGGEIKLRSKIHEGSTFSLRIPLEINEEEVATKTVIPKEIISQQPILEDSNKYVNYPTIKDDRSTIVQHDTVVLIIEDDLKFAAILLKQANDKGFKCLSASSGEDGLLLAAKYKPQAIILDISLPGINGHQVLHELKANPAVRHIPVHIISTNERSLDAIKEGAVEYLMKPIEKKDLEETFSRIENFVNRKIKNLLIIEDNISARKAMKILIGNGDVKCLEAGNGKEALAIYQQEHIDCIILDIGLPDMTGFELIHQLELIKDKPVPPIIVHTGKELTKEENNELQKYSDSIIIKGVKSEERLLDETALFLHRTVSNLPKSKQLIIKDLYDRELLFHGKKILLVDDDMRNIFALSKILQERGLEVIKAENGKIALEMLDFHKGIHLVLMDIMMPEMDGYEAMKRIRSNPTFHKLPVIALTAKAMKDDKQKCIDAGANDYITKPIDIDRLLSLMRVWLNK